MSLRFAKILSSGSPAEVTSITASELPELTGNDKKALVFSDTNGRFFSSSKIYYTGSGQLTAEEVNLSVFTITASGIPDNLTDRSSILFINEGGGFETTSSLRYLSTTNAIVFDGTFSGSFTGDGSGLTGVIGNTQFPLTNGVGIGSSSFDPSDPQISFNGSAPVTIAVVTSSNGGIISTGSGLQLDSSLPGNGLTWSFADNFSVMQVELSGSSNGSSGLKLDSNGLAISDNLDGDGLVLAGGSMSIVLAFNSGLDFQTTGGGKQLKLADSLPGIGLRFSSSNNILEVDPTEAITSSAEITFRTGSSGNLSLSVTSDGTITPVAQGFSARLIDQPQITYDVSDNLTGDFTITGDFTAQSDVTISGSSLQIGAETFIVDPFPLVNSGSGFTQGGFFIQVSANNGAYLIFDHTANAWALSNENVSNGTTNHSISTGNDYAFLASTRLVNDTTTNIVNSTPLFGAGIATQVGQMIVQTNPDTNESPLFIYA